MNAKSRGVEIDALLKVAYDAVREGRPDAAMAAIVEAHEILHDVRRRDFELAAFVVGWAFAH